MIVNVTLYPFIEEKNDLIHLNCSECTPEFLKLGKN